MSNENTPPNKVIDLNIIGDQKFARIAKNEQCEAFHVVIKAGCSLPPHQAQGSVIVQCLSGKGTFIIGDESQKLESGAWLYMPPKTMHAVEADETLTLLVIKILSDQQTI